MTEYRIVELLGSSNRIKIQRKFLWWWNDLRYAVPGNPDGPGASRIYWFDSIPEAEDFLHKKMSSRFKGMIVRKTILA